MFIGHGMAAFALVGAVALYRKDDRQRALWLAAVAALFATIPDVDILYGLFGLLNGAPGVFDAADAFWQAGNVVHRGPTHSLVLGAVTAGAVALWHRDRTLARLLAVGLLGAVVATATVESGSIAGGVTLVFALAALAVTRVSARLTLSTREVFATALLGLLSHPLGDLFTGEPPALLYPLNVPIVTERIALAADPTLHLLGAFAIELAIIWLGVAVFYRLTDRRVRSHIDRKATVGVAYGAAALTLPAPTLDTSYQFVFSVLGVGAIGVTQRQLLRRELRAIDWPRAVATGLTAVTLAALAYLTVYVLV